LHSDMYFPARVLGAAQFSAWAQSQRAAGARA
jgi:heme/copper-type cytochrome/quinol oxidase subunit 2